MKNYRTIQWLWVVISIVISIFSYAFVDVNLRLSDNPLFQTYLSTLPIIMYSHRLQSAAIFVFILVCLFALWWKTFQLAHLGQCGYRHIIVSIISVCALFVISYPFLSYDMFNYMATAKVSFTWQENPYVVMPIEIPNDPNLAFTRAANKLALYGPTWIILTWIPHTVGMGNVWLTIIAFKFLAIFFYLVMCYLVWHSTKKIENLIFFAFNPLILIEILISGHNDIVMMALAVAGLLMAFNGKRWIGLFLLTSSIFVKGSTVILTPLFFLRRIPLDKIWVISFWLMFGLFALATPIREELYPWYAVWFLCFSSLLPFHKKYNFIRGLSIAISFGLELRHVPYMAMGYYEGPGPLLRTLLTIIPVAVWGGWVLWRKTKVGKEK